MKKFVYLKKVLTKVSTDCVVIAFFVNKLSQVSSFKRKAVIIFHDYLIKEFLRVAALFPFIILWALFLVEELQRHNTLCRASKMYRLIRNRCNITGQKMIWSVKCILSYPTRSNFNKSYPFYRQIGFKIFLLNFVPTIDFTSSQFPAYEKRQYMNWIPIRK